LKIREERMRLAGEVCVGAGRRSPPPLRSTHRGSFETAVTAQRRVSGMSWRVGLLAGVAAITAVAGCSTSTQSGELPLRQVSETPLTGGPVRFDYTGLDVGRGRLFIAHMGASELIDVDVHAHAVVRTLPDLSDVHGVVVIPDKHRVYATATGGNQLVAIDEDSGAVVFRAPTDTYPDGLAYDPIRNSVWTTNEAAGTETVIDADTAAVRATVPLGGEVGNVVYDPHIDRMVVAVQGRDDLAVIDPVSFTVTERIPTPGCDHPHGQTLDVAEQVMFVGCEANATTVTVDLAKRSVIDRQAVGETPDVLAYDPGAHRVYVAAESGWVSIFDHDHGHLTMRGSAHLADGAHSIALDPTTHHSYIPIPKGQDGSPVLWEFEPT
jgi:DNA-binding beta-propeller fold protein YncE